MIRAPRLLAFLLAFLTLSPMGLVLFEAQAGALAEAPPDPLFVVTPGAGTTADLFTLDARGSHVPAGTSVRIEWGDGLADTGLLLATHRYERAGDYTVRLILTHDPLGSATAIASVRVRAMEPEAWSDRESDWLKTGGVLPNHAITPAQAYGLLSQGVGPVAVLVTGLDPRVLPIGTAEGSPNLTYVDCAAGCVRELDFSKLRDVDGVSTGAFSILLQKVLNASYYAINVQDAQGRVTLPVLAQALAFAESLQPVAVVSLVPPDAGFLDTSGAINAYNPDLMLGRYGSPDALQQPERVALLRALALERAQYDYGNNSTYPVPNGYSEISAPAHDHGYGHGAHGGGGHGGGYAEVQLHQVSESCVPLPVPGPREDRPAQTIPTYQRFEDSLKGFKDTTPADLAGLSPMESLALEALGAYYRDLVCLQHVLSHLAHQGIPVVVPAGDSASHVRADTPTNALWDLQSLRGMAEFPQVITVGATTSAATTYGAPYFGTKRIVLPTSAAGPTRSLQGVKPDFVAPGDVPGVLTGQAYAGTWYVPEYATLYDGYAQNETGAWLHGNATPSAERLVLPGEDVLSGAVYNGSRNLAPQPVLNVTVSFETPPSGVESRNSFRFVAASSPAWDFSYGFGFEISPLADGNLSVSSRVHYGGSDYVPNCGIVCQNIVKTVVVANDGPLTLRITTTPQSTRVNHHLLTYEIVGSDGLVRAALTREAPVDGTGALCACRHVNLLSTLVRPGAAGWTRASFDDLTVNGLSGPAHARYDDDMPVADYGPVGVRPSTRYAAAYAAGLAIVHHVPLLATETDPMHRVERLRGVLAGLAKPMESVPPFVQGAGELNLDVAAAANNLLATQNQVPGTPGVDFGLRLNPDGRARLHFHWDDYLTPHQVHVQTTGLAWYRVDRNRNLVANAEAPGLSWVSFTEGEDERVGWLNLTSLPVTDGVYAAIVPIGISTGVGTVANPLYAKTQLVVMVTKGVLSTMDLSNLDAPAGATAWLLPPVNANKNLVHDPLPGGPAFNATVASNQRISWGVIGPATYALALAVEASLPVPDNASATRVHEASRPRDFFVVSKGVRPLNGTWALSALDGTARMPTPVAFRFLDIVEGSSFSWRQADPRATNGQIFRGRPNLTNGRWDARGDPRPGGHALDDPFPVGETPEGWDLRAAPRAPPAGLGNRSSADARALYADALASATYRPGSLTGHLDPRPYAFNGTSRMPVFVASTSVDLPGPLDEVHGVLLLPFEADEATTLLRIAAGTQEATVLLTDEGAWVPGPANGSLTWPVEKDRFDNLSDTHAGGLLSGRGHHHGREVPDLRLVPRTASGHLVPFAFHDVSANVTSLTVSVLVRPDPTALAGRAWSAGTLDPVPGPRFRLESAAVYAWTSGLALRDTSGQTTLRLGKPDRFVLPAVPDAPDPLREPLVRVAPFDERGHPQGEVLEVYLRSERATLRLTDTANGKAQDSAGANFTRVLVGNPQTLSFAYGRGVNPLVDPLMHPREVLRPYGDVTPVSRVEHERFIDFASIGPSLWKVDGRALLKSASATGDVKVHYRAGLTVPASTLAPLPPRFPDFADPAPPGGSLVGDCSYDGAGLVGVLVGPLVRLGCYVAAYGYEAAQSVQDERLDAGSASDDRTGARGACLDGRAGEGCLGDPLMQVESVDGTVRSAYATLRTILLGSEATPAPSGLWEGVVPSGGALLVLDHAVGGAGTASVNATIVFENASHRLATLEGQDVFRASDARLRETRLDAFDLSGFAGERIRIDLVTEGGASWNVARWRVLPLATPAFVAAQHTPAWLNDSLPHRPSARLHAVHNDSDVRAGPSQQARAADPDHGLVHLPAGLEVKGLAALAHRHLLVGGDVDQGGLLHVPAGATLALDNVTIAPRSLGLPWGILVEKGGKLFVNDSTLVAGGHARLGLAAIDVREGGAVFFNRSDLLGGHTGIRLHPGATLLSQGAAFGGLARAIEAEGATLTLLDALVDGNAEGVVARNATLEIAGGQYVSNRLGALRLQDTLAAIGGATFAWNGEAGPRAALVAHEGLDTGRVVLHETRFLHNARALLARSPVDLHNLTVHQDAPDALRVGPDATVRLAHGNVTSTGGAALTLEAGARLYANASTLDGRPWIDCGPRPPAFALLDDVVLKGTNDTTCPAFAYPTGANLTAPERWRALVARPFLQAGPNPVLVLPRGLDAALEDVRDGNQRQNLTLSGGTLTIEGPDRQLSVVAAPLNGAPAPGAWGYDLLKDSSAPTGGLSLLAGTYVDANGTRFLRGLSTPMSLTADDGQGSGPGALALVLDTKKADNTTGVVNARIADDVRGNRAILGLGAKAPLHPVSGELVNLTPLLRDRAGNGAPGSVVSVVVDRTPPRAWLHAANPCGDLFGYDLGWYAHDPRVGSGLRPAGVPPNPKDNWTYVLSVASVNLSATLDAGDIDTLLDIVDLGTVDRLRQANPQGLNSQALRELDRRLNDPLNGHWLTDLPLIDWIEVQRFTRDETGIRLSLVKDVEDLIERNLGTTQARAAELVESKDDVEAWLKAIRDARLQDVKAHDKVDQTLDRVIANLTKELENVRKLTPVILAIRIEARDAVGNRAYWYEPVLSDVFSPTHLFYFLGDYVRERVMPMLLAPEASLDLHDLHGEISVFDPDCGLQDVRLLERLPESLPTPIATVYPREGRVTFNVTNVSSYFPPNLCGKKSLQVLSTDQFGRQSRVDFDTILDRRAPQTTLVDWERVMEVPLLPVSPMVPPPAVNPSWINQHGFRVLADATSLNLPECPLVAASIHEMDVEAAIANLTWITLDREHFGAARNGSLVNTSVRLNATTKVQAKDFGMSDAQLSGRWVDFRVRASDEAGNEERDSSATFGFRVDTVPPLCTIDHVEAKGGTTLPLQWTTKDELQAEPGEPLQAGLLFRPTPEGTTEVEWSFFSWLPQPTGTASATLAYLPPWAGGPVLHDVQLACAAYDQAGNLGIGPAARTLLDLELPIVNWTTLAPAWANASFVLEWTVDEVVSGVDYVLVYAGETGQELTLQANHSVQYNNSFLLDPVLLSGGTGDLSAHNGENWTVRVEAYDKAGNRYQRLHTVLFDTTAPTGNLTNVADALVGGFLPVSMYEFVPNMEDGTTLPQAPFDPRLEVKDGSGTTVFRLEPDGKFHLGFGTDGNLQMRLVPCDAAGNCGEPTAWLDFTVDVQAPVTGLVQLGPGNLLASPLPGTSLEVSWVESEMYAHFLVSDPTGSSGIANLSVHARPLNTFTREPDGPAIEMAVTDLGAEAGGRRYNASLSGLAPDHLYRFEVSARDAAGNREMTLTGEHRPLEVFFAHDATAPVALIQPLAPFLNALPVSLAITLVDDVNGLGSGVQSFHVEYVREGGTKVVRPVVPAANARWTNLTWRESNLTLPGDEGYLLSWCVVAKDRVGRVGTCDGEATTVLDVTPPTVTLTLPSDASLSDPWTSDLDAQVQVNVVNTAPRARAAPVGEVMLEIASSDLSRPPSLRRNLAQESWDVAPGASATVPFDLDGSDGQIYLLRAYVADTAGNRRLPGTDSHNSVNRNTTEVAHWSFDYSDGMADVSGHGHTLGWPNSGFNPSFGSTEGRSGSRPTLYFGDDYFYRQATFGFGNAMTATVWVYPTEADQTGGILGRSALARDWGIWVDNGWPKATLHVDSGNATLTGVKKLEPNQWHHLALVYDGQFLRFYVDGQASPPSPLTGSVVETGELRIGAAADGSVVRGFRGRIDEVRLYRTGLSLADVNDVAAYPYPSGVPATVLHLDATAPVSLPAPHDLLQAVPTINAHAYDVGPGKPSGVKSVRIEERLLDSTLGYVPEAVPKEGWLEVAQEPNANVPANAEVRITRPLRLPAGTYHVRLDVADSLGLAPNAPACNPTETGLQEKARWRVLLGGIELGGRYVGATDATEQSYVLNATIAGAADLVLSVVTPQQWKACYPRLVVRFDDVQVRDANGVSVFTDGLFDQGAWAITGNGAMVGRFAQASVPWSSAASPTSLYAQTWDDVSYGGWELQTGHDPATRQSLVAGGSDGFAYALVHEGTTGGSGTLYDRGGRQLPQAVDATHLFVLEKTTRTDNTRSRPGIQVDYTDGNSLVFYFENTMINALPTQVDPITQRTYHFVPATDEHTSGQWSEHMIDLTAAKAAKNVAGQVMGVYAYLEKHATPAPGEPFGASVALDDVRLLSGARTRVDLPFRFPFYGKSYETVYADENGVLGFEPGFDAAPTASAFAQQRVIAPAWGDWTLAGVDESAAPYRPHGVYVDGSVSNQTTILWLVGSPADRGATNAFAVTLFDTGEMLTTYRNVPARGNLLRAGVSPGAGATQLPLDRTDALPASLAGVEEGWMPGTGGWSEKATRPHWTGLPLTPDVPLHVRTRAIDQADNLEPASGPRARVTRDATGPLVSVAPILESTGGLAERRLRILTTLVDNLTTVDPASVDLTIWNLTSLADATLTSPPLGEARASDSGFDVYHRVRYALNLSARDRFGILGWDNRTFDAVILPEPVLALDRALEGATYVDDVLLGAVPGQTGIVTGDRLSAAGKASLSAGNVWLNVTLDGKALVKESGPSVSFRTSADVAALSEGEHVLLVRAEAANGAFRESNYTFRVQNGTRLASTDVENDTAAWWHPDHTATERADPEAAALRRGTLGMSVKAASDASLVPFARYNLSEAATGARYWAFVRFPAAPGGQGFEALRLATPNGTAFSARVDSKMVLWALDGGAWVNTTASVHVGHWSKIEAKDQGSHVSLYLNQTYLGTYARSNAEPVTAFVFSAADAAASGTMHVDDVAADRADQVKRVMVSEDFDAPPFGWTPELPDNHVQDAFNRYALQLDSTASAPLSVGTTFRPTAPDYVLSLSVGLFGRGCAGEGRIAALLDAADATILDLRCEGTTLRVGDGASLVNATRPLVSGKYNRLVAHVGSGHYTLFLNDAFVGVFNLTADAPAAGLRVGGGNAELWFNDAQLFRGRLLLSEGFDDVLSNAWRLPAGSATLNASASGAQAVTASKSLRVHSAGGLNEVGWVERNVTLPKRFLAAVRVYVPPATTFDDLQVLTLGTAAGADAGFVITKRGVDPTPQLAARRTGTTTPAFLGAIGSGWHWLAMDVDQATGRWYPYWNGHLASILGEPITTEPLTRLYAGDTSLAAGQGTVHLDDLQFVGLNLLPEVYISSPAAGSVAKGSVTIRGSAHDPDFGDAPDFIELVIDGTPVRVANAPDWQYEWSTAALGGTTHTVWARAWQEDGRDIYGASPTRTYSVSTT